ncbi:glyoxylase-like metal-dependent hydrolase (beta-lactamase superfamily II) [Virgibacillus natechei]|uniref:Glyoxylase-like metal-dependent hydrolase (Beta-lactamase superfamily II) n=1 Tax=Virgibacillus natechei TaxID=1216297 RepID=A0ABS4IJW8_9BACI|nr:MBL fold metallo-hydrolase [Virgibacillus natechei]MBP1971153.1 glyoxylase-like metal-dependent hydrolase (beta-lactamase superfamily II) [Virgibacillus natechei]UZD12164.1 MBL fold metallo-hydrolase [Virgibacillus natechei]
MSGKHDFPVIYPIIVPTSSSLATFNFYLVKNQGTLMLIDAGVDSQKCWDYFNDVLQKNNFKLKDIDKIILTHSHQDHTGLVNRILDLHDVRVYAHPDAIVRLQRNEAYLMKRIAFFQSFYAEMGCGERGEKQVELLKRRATENKSQSIQVKITPLKEGDSLDGFQVIETPGHWPDHIALYHPKTGICLAGDHLVEHISSNALIEPDGEGRRLYTLQQYENALKKCQLYALTTVYPGHGEIVDDPAVLIEERLHGIERKSKKIKDVIARIQPCTAARVAKEYYKKTYDIEFSLVMSEIVGHLDRLEGLGEVEKREKDGIWEYGVSGD